MDKRIETFKLTRLGFKRWLLAGVREGRVDTLACANANRCAIARYVAERTGAFVSVSMYEIYLFLSAEDRNRGNFSRAVKKTEVPAWAWAFIKEFDAAKCPQTRRAVKRRTFFQTALILGTIPKGA